MRMPERNKLKIYINYLIQIIILLFVIIYFVNQVTPILKAAKYAHPTTDDYWMSGYVHTEWIKSHSIFKTIGAAFDYAVRMYKTWDGNFLSMFLTALSPLVINEFYYGVVTFYFMFISLIAGAGMVSYSLLFRRWRIPLINCISMMLLFVIFFLNYITNSGEGLYWWPGVVNYTIFCGFLLLAQGLFIMYWEKGKKVWLVLASITFFIVGLGNPLTGLINVCLLVYELAYRIYEKKSIKTLYWIPFACAFISLMIVVLAPGNAVRLPQSQDRLNIFELVYICFRDGSIMMKAITKPAVIIYYIMVAIISFISFYNKETEQRKFVLPGLYVVLMICLYYAAYAPIMYSGGKAGAQFYGRLLDTTYFIMLMTFTVSIIYLCGALAGYLKRKKTSDIIKMAVSAVAIIGIAICISTVKKPQYYFESTCYHADFALKDGTMGRFNDILYDRYQQLINPSEPVVYTERAPYVRVFWHADDDSFLEMMEDYFGKTIIVIE